MIRYTLRFVSCLFLLMFFSGCEVFNLNVTPSSSITDANFWKNKGQVESFMAGIHGRFRTHSFNLFQLGSLRADEFGDEPFGGESTGGLGVLFNNTLNAQNTGIVGFADFYTNINQINLFIFKLQTADFIEGREMRYLLGQAYGLRAFYYFQLLKSWGNVVIHRKPSIAFELNDLSKEASGEDEVIALIKSDIDQSEMHFSDDYSFKNSSRTLWSKSATLTLKSEVYLWSSKQMGGGRADAGIAKSALTELQNMVPELGLLSNFSDVFKYENKNNKEIVFAIHNGLNEYTTLGGLSLETMLPQITYIGLYHDSLENRPIRKETDLVQVTGGGMTTAVKVATFRRFDDQDSRKHISIQGVYKKDNTEYTIAGCYLKKYKGTFFGGARAFVDDFPIYRYSDVLLLLAEAKIVLGENPANEINLVRARAYGTKYVPEIHSFPNKTGDSNTEEALLNERLFEFLGEGKRWYDLRRFGKKYVFKYTTAKEDYQLYWPIDIGSLTRNRSLKQTPGY